MEKRRRTKRLFVVLYLYVIGELFIMSIKIDYSCCARNKRSLLSFARRKIEKYRFKEEN